MLSDALISGCWSCNHEVSVTRDLYAVVLIHLKICKCLHIQLFGGHLYMEISERRSVRFGHSC